MQWYLAKLVYRVLCEGHCSQPAEFDEQIRLIHAEDELHAFQKARLMGEKEGEVQMQCSGSIINWKFVDITELHKLDAFIDGAEMYSQIRIQENADAYIRDTQKKALYLFDHAVNSFTGSF
jgi:hypothetical protein